VKCSTVGGTAKNGRRSHGHSEQQALRKVDACGFSERVPIDHQDVALRRLDALVDLVAAKALGLRDDRLDAALDRGVELRPACAAAMRMSAIRESSVASLG